MGTYTHIATDDGRAEAYLTGSGPGVLFFMDAIGVRPQITYMADRIASWGYTVLVPNVFYRLGDIEDLQPTLDLTVPENRSAFGQVTAPRVSGYAPNLSNPDTERWLDALADSAADGPMATTGYCMGARLAVRTAALRPDHIAAVGGFHGAKLVDDTNTSPHLLLAGTRAEYVFGHADNDQLNTADDIAELGRRIADAGLTAHNEIYPDAPHGYTMADTSSYQEAGAERMFRQLHALLDRTIGADTAN